jgi:beta-lactamase regulating signal transducer with metallopeptidase domain
MIGLILTGLLKANLAAGLGVLVVLALRTAMRPRFGAGAAYLMWLAPLAAGLAVLAPHPAVRTAMTPMVQTATAAVEAFVATAPAQAPAGPDLASLAFGLWIVGVAATAGLLLRRQAAFLSAMGRLERLADGVFRAQSAEAGPAVVGVLCPRIVAPADFETRFGPKERELILAHERVHLRRGDAAVNAVACAVQCLCWFNPLVHLAARTLRIDQELACDASVIGAFPAERRTYAELLLKTQLAAQPLPLGCHWAAGSAHPLKARIAMLTAPLPLPAMRGLGLGVAAALTLGAGGLAWAAQPAASAAGPGPAQRAEALRQLAAYPTYSCDPAIENAGGGCKVIPLSPWLAVPTPQDKARVYPAGAREAGQTARVLLDCKTTTTGLLKDCGVKTVTVQVPAGEGATQATQDSFGEAAVKLAPYYQLRLDGVKAPVREGMAHLKVDFGSDAPSWAPPAGFAEPRPSAQAAPFHSIWLKKPTAEDLVRLYPADAVAKDLTADVLMACKVDADGRLNGCDIKRVDVSGAHVPDNPADDPGFGAATLELAKFFQMEPVSAAGQPTAGTEIRIPVRFRLPHPSQPVTPS